ncbi:MAG: winged helix DNA-binding domain-containing protein, partial [Anaerolineales bacterium]|nr:winged helix DNA-binding domain-containing protein [Anaerolineales bacterium]
RSQDIFLHSRVLDYKPEHLYQVMYKERQFFDYGGHLHVYPMSDLPYWRVHMERRSHEKRVEDFVFSHDGLFDGVRAELRKRGPLGNRDFTGNAVGSNYRGRKDTALALFDMWLSGELMIHHRNRFDRVYDFREHIAPPELDYIASEDETEDFFVRKTIAFMGLVREGNLKTNLEYFLRRKFSPGEMKKLLERWIGQGNARQVKVEERNDKYLALGEDVSLLKALEAGKIPKAWNPIGPSTLDEVSFLAPLDIVSARGRAKKVFDFEYLWEVYKPLEQRRWGYYTLPILYGDDLVARLDPKLDRTTMTLQIKGFWHEDDAPVKDPAFATALARGLFRFVNFVGAKKINIVGIRPLSLRKAVKTILGGNMDVDAKPL